MSQVLSQPTRNDERVKTLDFCRGIAVLGIFLCNIAFMAVPFEGLMSFSYRESIPFLQNFVFVWGMFFDGTQRGIFSLLFGIGMLIFLERNSSKIGPGPAADLYFRRIAFLFLFGLMNAYLFLWGGDILAPYAFYTFIAFAFRNSSQKTLITMASVLIVILSLIVVAGSLSTLEEHKAYQAAQTISDNGGELTEEQQKAIDTWEKKPDMEAIDKTVKAATSGIGGAWKNSFAELSMVLSYVYYGSLFDIIPMFFLGIVLYRWGIFKADFPLTKLVYPGILLVASAWIWRYFDAYYGTMVFDRVLSAYIAPLGPLVRAMLTLGYTFLFIAAYRYTYRLFIAKALVAVGQMALTNYLSQSIVGAVLFYGFGLYGVLNGAEIMLVVFAVWFFQLTVSSIWLQYFRFGPFEWLWRSLTYGQSQPFKRRSVQLNVASVEP
ncbi:DUF418 domain-containing protein [Alteromonas lipolytica]|uniref:DUF418 domain-containing protein n=1 Tax=Alteromonas lipolytica TaxID=1856405 RepID=A0A1E8FF05_9ALTE|nr:DUF418 domain-containing protein [Alteromonas lipolytica]OFI34490.1 hypothetical protein BFC17_17805 [Alteromonas lipolytica]GGF84992.1 hypothetical protein GCM10011338_41660 [Alteromonas lipolytica]